jgi:phosphatidylglycerol:prolipoprotein diacylglycerol transferase
MCPTILHIYGPFAINSYGFFIVIGILIALWCAHRDAQSAKLITNEQALTLLSGSVIAGIFGARALYFLLEHVTVTWYDFFAFWQGGGTELGSIIAITLFAGYYLYKHGIPLLELLDLAANYAPLVQGFARIGCFCAGCCHGSFTSWPCAVTYTHPASLAPLNIPVHPTQLYASALFFLLFLFMRYYATRWDKPGQQFALYLMGASFIRFSIDFWRGDLVYPATQHPLISLFTTYQWVSIGIFAIATIGLIASSYRSSRRGWL